LKTLFRHGSINTNIHVKHGQGRQNTLVPIIKLCSTAQKNDHNNVHSDLKICHRLFKQLI